MPARCRAPSSSSAPTGSACAAIPHPAGTISFGGPAVPGWVDGALRDMVSGWSSHQQREASCAAPIERIVDAHIHLWDPANAEWYPYLAGQRELDMGDISGMCRLFDQPTYFAESSNWNVVKFVHVAAATAPYSGAETAHLQELAEATGHPDAIIGGIVPQDPIADTERLLDEQMQSPRFRGIRPMGGAMGVPGADVLRRSPSVT